MVKKGTIKTTVITSLLAPKTQFSMALRSVAPTEPTQDAVAVAEVVEAKVDPELVKAEADLDKVDRPLHKDVVVPDKVPAKADPVVKVVGPDKVAVLVDAVVKTEGKVVLVQAKPLAVKVVVDKVGKAT